MTLIADGLREMWERRRLIRFLVAADLKRTHADTIIGQLWWILDPLLQMAIYAVLIGLIFNRSIADFPLFLFAAILPWKWFSSALADASTSITGRGSLIRQVQFPKIVLPAAGVFAATVSFVFGLIALAIMLVVYLPRLDPLLLTLPIVAGVQLVFTLGLSIAIAAVNAFYRDVQNVLRHVLRLWWYLSPGLYAVEHVPEGTLRTLYSLNPFATLFTSYRKIIWGDFEGGSRMPDVVALAGVLALGLVMLAVGVYLFMRVEPAFARIL